MISFGYTEEIVAILKANESKKALRVLGFFVGKGLLWVNYPMTPFFGKIRIEDVLWVAEEVEPRVLEVFPAAFLHFPKTFIGRHDLPEDLREVVTKVRDGNFEPHEVYKGIRLDAMAKWNNRTFKDRRTKPANQKKVNKTFRMDQSLVKKLETTAKQLKMSQIEWLEKLILEA